MADVLARLRAAFETRDLEALGALLADDVRWRSCRGRDDVLAVLRERFATAPPALHAARQAGDRLVLRMTLHGFRASAGWRSPPTTPA